MTELDLKAAIQKVSSFFIEKISRAKWILQLPSWQIRGSFQWDFIFLICVISIYNVDVLFQAVAEKFRQMSSDRGGHTQPSLHFCWTFLPYTRVRRQGHAPYSTHPGEVA